MGDGGAVHRGKLITYRGRDNRGISARKKRRFSQIIILFTPNHWENPRTDRIGPKNRQKRYSLTIL